MRPVAIRPELVRSMPAAAAIRHQDSDSGMPGATWDDDVAGTPAQVCCRLAPVTAPVMHHLEAKSWPSPVPDQHFDCLVVIGLVQYACSPCNGQCTA